MKTRNFSIFRRISILFFSLISILCLLFAGLTYFSISDFHEASTQSLNKEVASHIATFTSPFTGDGIDKKKADSVFYDAMVLSPSAEVYFLDTLGKVIAFHAEKKEIKQWMIPLGNIQKLISSRGKDYIKNTDPKDPVNKKIFSAAEVWHQSKKLGYIYVILGSNKSISQNLFASYFGSLLLKVASVIIILSIAFTFFYINRIQKSFMGMIAILERFQKGDLSARFPMKENDELAPVTTAFNNMADMLVYNINKLTNSEKERKDFVANISHDLRTPLSIARGYAETILIKNEKQISQQELEDFIQLIYRKIRQVEHLVKQLFELSKMEAVEFEPKKEPFVFSEIVQEVINDSSATANEKSITIESSGCRDASWIFADVAMMERVVQNLMVNAIKYTSENGYIKVSLKKDANTLVLTIQNNGQVINSAIVNWFNNESASSLLSNRPSNSGIGLVIVKKILQLHQFKYEVITQADIGNTFVLYIPVRKGA